MKVCIACGTSKDEVEYYVHEKMADGRLNKCKECCKAAAKSRYATKRDDVLEYERRRSRNPERRARAVEYQRNGRARHPEKKTARAAVAYAVRCGRLIRQPCEVCGDVKSQAHHEDYTKPLDVRWLCFKCHREHGHGQTVTAA